MNILIFLFYFLPFICNNNANNYEKYKKAFEYICNSDIPKNNLNIDKTIKDKFTFFVSDRIYYIDKLFLIDDIINYEYKEIEIVKRKVIKDSIKYAEIQLLVLRSDDTSYYCIPELNNFNNERNYDFQIFFSDFDEFNRVSARLLLFTGNKNIVNASYDSQEGIDFMFYFDGENIKNVLYVKWQQ